MKTSKPIGGIGPAMPGYSPKQLLTARKPK